MLFEKKKSVQNRANFILTILPQRRLTNSTLISSGISVSNDHTSFVDNIWLIQQIILPSVAEGAYLSVGEDKARLLHKHCTYIDYSFCGFWHSCKLYLFTYTYLHKLCEYMECIKGQEICPMKSIQYTVVS